MSAPPFGSGIYSIQEDAESGSDADSESYDPFAFDCSKGHLTKKSTHIVFIVDMSASMKRPDVVGSEGRRIDVVWRMCKEFVENQAYKKETLNDNYSLILFNDDASLEFERLDAAGALDTFRNRWVGRCFRGTKYRAGLEKLRSVVRDSSGGSLNLPCAGKHLLRALLLSDGRPCDWSETTLTWFQTEWLPEMRELCPSVEIHTIGFGPSESDFDVLQQISVLGRGTMQVADLNVSALRRGFTSISTRMTSSRYANDETSNAPVMGGNVCATRVLTFSTPPRNHRSPFKPVHFTCNRYTYDWHPTIELSLVDLCEEVSVVRAENPFTKGSMRFVYDMREVDDRQMVAKVTMLESSCEAMETFFVKSSACADYFAALFRKRTSLSVRIVPCFLYETRCHLPTEDDPIAWFCGEQFVQGVFTKWISNNGYISESPDTDVLASFAHFTYVESKSQLLVTDLQGVRSGARYILTDPQVLSMDNRFGRADLGMDGIQQFFAAHRCGPLCRTLGIANGKSRAPSGGLPMSANSSQMTKTTALGERMDTHLLFKPVMFFVGECSLSFSSAAAKLYTEKCPNAPIKDWYLTELQWPQHSVTKDELYRNIAHFIQTFGDAVQISYPGSVDATKIPPRMHDEPPFDRCIWSMPYPDDFSPQRTPINSPALKAEMRRRVHGFVKAAAPLLKPSVDAYVSVVLVARQHVDWGLREPVQTEKCGMLFPEVHVFRLQELLDRGYVPRFGDDRDAHGRVASYHHGSEAVVVSWRRLASPLPSSGGISDAKLRRRNNF